MIHGLIANLAVVGLFVSVWLFAKEALVRHDRRKRAVVLGVLIGLGSIATMAMAVRTGDGVLFDLRFALLATAAYIQGPIVGIIAGIAAMAFRFASGGAGWFAGCVGIFLTVLIGVAAHKWLPLRWNFRQCVPRVLLVTFAASVLPNVAALLLPIELIDARLGRALAMMTVMNFIGMLFVVAAVWNGNLRLRERALMIAAIAQAPDYFYVKDRQSRFVAVNKTVAAHHDPSLRKSLVGKSDRDLETDRADELFAAEQALMQKPEGQMHLRETLDLPGGETRVYETTKVSVSDVDGQVIGLVGITRDITDAVEAELQLHEDQRLLVSILSKMTDGVALFDDEARLVFCNDQYHAFFSLTRDVRVPGVELAAILRAAAERREQLDIPRDNVEEWVQTVAQGMMRGGEEEVRLFDGRTIIARTRVVPGLGSISVVSDITDMRLSEKRLAGLVSEMETLARTDGLTGVVNRRAFDEQLEREVARSRRNGEPVSLIMLDVDHFKAFNDFHGHPEGDACLKRVANILSSQMRRGSDMLARYGGEEFGVVLPDTDEDGALVFAETLRTAVEAAGIAHGASEAGVVTASLGVATLPAGVTGLSAADLLKMADIALYGAKRNGRNRVMQYSRLLGSVIADPAEDQSPGRKVC
ncbi:diguanylate cyclase [Oricola sp.]|uniref:diguanylate cyclase n=1 Tax=Oricola sp. TaxID=1979950 RepID=UPI0025FB4B6D|nr:diguanylate cyclase [Oricola sp.]MCI5075255.1 diguanylate cyclase [Oricola sp.]